MMYSSRDNKRNRFTQTSEKRRGLLSLVIFGIGLAVAIPIGMWAMRREAPHAPTAADPAIPKPAAAAAAGAEVRVPVAELARGEAKFVDYKTSAGGTTRLFAIKGTDGEYRAALDACEVCYHGKKGYAQQGDKMVCRQCGNAYEPALIDKAPGGCHPVGVPRRVEGDVLVVKGSDIEAAEKKLALAASAAATPR